MADYIRMTISKDLENQIETMQKKIKEIFGLEISKIKASKIVAYKSRKANLTLDEKKLIEILGGRL